MQLISAEFIKTHFIWICAKIVTFFFRKSLFGLDKKLPSSLPLPRHHQKKNRPFCSQLPPCQNWSQDVPLFFSSSFQTCRDAFLRRPMEESNMLFKKGVSRKQQLHAFMSFSEVSKKAFSDPNSGHRKRACHSLAQHRTKFVVAPSTPLSLLCVPMYWLIILLPAAESVLP